MADIQRRGGPQLASLLRRFGITRVLSGSQISEDVTAVAQVPRLDNLCGGNGDIAVLAANRSMVQLFNPVGSGVTVILHKVWVALTVPGRFTLRTSVVALADAITTLTVLNRRLGNQPEPSAQMRSLRGTGVGGPDLSWTIDIADRSYEFDLQRLDASQEFHGPSLAEGRGYTMVPDTDNVGAEVTYLWSERITQD